MTKQFKQLLGLLILSLFLGLFRYFLLEEEYPLFNNTKNEQIFTVESDSMKFVKDYRKEDRLQLQMMVDYYLPTGKKELENFKN